MIASRSIAACALIVIVIPAVEGVSRAENSPGSFAELKRKHEERDELIRRRMAQAKSGPDRAVVQEDIWREVRSAASQAFAWADTHRDDPEAIDAIVWTVHGLANGYYAEYSDEITQAFGRLTERAIDNEKIVPVCYYAAGSGFACPTAKRFLETALEKSSSRLVRGAACLGLARAYHRLSEFIRHSRDPITRKPLEEWNGFELVARLESGDPEENDRQAETYYERIIRDFGDLKMPSPYNQTLFAELARGELYELRFLAIGKVMPELKGEDVRGQTLRLSDYRGKVVAIVFWATWCAPCMEMVPHERELVKRMVSKPFVLQGVNGDEKRAKAVEVMTKESMTWPCLWNGGTTGGFVEKLGVRSWPTIYLLDAKGIIRFKNVRGKDLDEAVDRLVAEAGARP